MDEPSLEGVVAKLDRADTYRDGLNKWEQRFLQENPYRIVSEEDPKTGECLLKGQILKEPPIIDWGVEVGDFFHNLRSALDNLAWQLCICHRPKREPPRRTEFPIFRDCSLFESNGRARICGMSKAAQDVMRDLQPCYGPQKPESHPLFYVHEMNNADKHRVFHVTSGAIAAVSYGGDIFEQRGISEAVLIHSPYTFNHDEVVARLPPIPDCAKLAQQLHPIFHVAFDKEGPGRGWPLAWGLKRWGNYVREQVIPKFVHFFPPEGRKAAHKAAP
jgi:hypothetical protein